jgi:hypothetical protein
MATPAMITKPRTTIRLPTAVCVAGLVLDAAEDRHHPRHHRPILGNSNLDASPQREHVDDRFSVDARLSQVDKRQIWYNPACSIA